MKVVNRIRYGWHIDEIQQIAGMYKVIVDKQEPGTLHATQKDAENDVIKLAREFIGIKVD